MKLKVLIADDEKNVREAVSGILNLYCEDVEIVGEASSAASTIKAIANLAPDVVLLDIDLRDGTGFDVVKHFKAPKFKIIFITAFQEYAIQAFRFSALDYILKPVQPELLTAAIKKAHEVVDQQLASITLETFIHNIDNLSKGPKKIVLNTQDTVHVVKVSDIVRLEADGNYTRFFILDQKKVILVSRSLIDYEEMLSPLGFLRSHHSHLVNLAQVDRFEKKEGGKLVMKDGSEALVSVRKKDELLAALGRV
jgi:two-component system LytT family response regulator